MDRIMELIKKIDFANFTHTEIIIFLKQVIFTVIPYVGESADLVCDEILSLCEHVSDEHERLSRPI